MMDRLEMRFHPLGSVLDVVAKVVKVGPFGGSAGEMFDTGVADQLLEIKIRSGIAVDAIIITYLVNGRIETRRFGGEGGEESLQKEFRPGEYLIEISGSSNRHGFIQSLKFRTNLDTKVPHVPEEGIPFSVPVMNGGYLDPLGYVAGKSRRDVSRHLFGLGLVGLQPAHLHSYSNLLKMRSNWGTSEAGTDDSLLELKQTLTSAPTRCSRIQSISVRRTLQESRFIKKNQLIIDHRSIFVAANSKPLRCL
ncbi:putative Horcolin [Cocos nucifera]|uniref:Putative Horcolin n=1 Tax=Cocos nucifera TaxID=13894 RepID=A0A8K0ICS3_COCNU|nr:putative Horcolin [Cocos nucifera]